MLAPLRGHLTYANVVSTLCLFILLGGVAYAAGLGKNTVGAAQIKPNAVTGSEIKPNSVTSSDVKNSTLRTADFAAGQIPQGPQGDRGPTGASGATNVITRQTGPNTCDTEGCNVFLNAMCLAGESAVGGGGYSDADDYIRSSVPVAGAIEGWQVDVKDEAGVGNSAANVRTYVVCASP